MPDEAKWKITLLGPFSMHLQGEQIAKPWQVDTFEKKVLIYLLMHPDCWLTDIEKAIWGGPNTSNTVSKAVGKLKDIIGAETMERPDHRAKLDLSYFEVDVNQFQDRLADAKRVLPYAPEKLRTLIEAVLLYNGPFVSGVESPGTWLQDTRIELSHCYCSALQSMATLLHCAKTTQRDKQDLVEKLIRSCLDNENELDRHLHKKDRIALKHWYQSWQADGGEMDAERVAEAVKRDPDLSAEALLKPVLDHSVLFSSSLKVEDTKPVPGVESTESVSEDRDDPPISADQQNIIHSYRSSLAASLHELFALALPTFERDTNDPVDLSREFVAAFAHQTRRSGASDWARELVEQLRKRGLPEIRLSADEPDLWPDAIVEAAGVYFTTKLREQNPTLWNELALTNTDPVVVTSAMIEQLGKARSERDAFHRASNHKQEKLSAAEEQARSTAEALTATIADAVTTQEKLSAAEDQVRSIGRRWRLRATGIAVVSVVLGVVCVVLGWPRIFPESVVVKMNWGVDAPLMASTNGVAFKIKAAEDGKQNLWDAAIKEFGEAYRRDSSDAEAKICLQNMQVMKLTNGHPDCIVGVPLPIQSNLSSQTNQILIGIAQEQERLITGKSALGRTCVKIVLIDDQQPESTAPEPIEKWKQTVAMKIAEKAKREQWTALIGHYNSDFTLAACSIYRDNGIICISPTSSSPSLEPYSELKSFFRTIASDGENMPLLARATIQDILDKAQISSPKPTEREIHFHVYSTSSSNYSRNCQQRYVDSIKEEWKKKKAELSKYGFTMVLPHVNELESPKATDNQPLPAEQCDRFDVMACFPSVKTHKSLRAVLRAKKASIELVYSSDTIDSPAIKDGAKDNILKDIRVVLPYNTQAGQLNWRSQAGSEALRYLCQAFQESKTHITSFQSSLSNYFDRTGRPKDLRPRLYQYDPATESFIPDDLLNRELFKGTP